MHEKTNYTSKCLAAKYSLDDPGFPLSLFYQLVLKIDKKNISQLTWTRLLQKLLSNTDGLYGISYVAHFIIIINANMPK